ACSPPGKMPMTLSTPPGIAWRVTSSPSERNCSATQSAVARPPSWYEPRPLRAGAVSQATSAMSASAVIAANGSGGGGGGGGDGAAAGSAAGRGAPPPAHAATSAAAAIHPRLAILLA